MDSLEKLINRDEIRRLEKAAREKDKKHLVEWAKKYEQQIEFIMRQYYEKMYQEEINDSINNFIFAVAYTAFFSEETNLNNETLPEFMSDLFATIDMYRTGEFTPQEYVKELSDNGFVVDDITYKPREHQVITVCGNFDKNLFNKLSNQNKIVIFANNNKELNVSKIRVADEVYITDEEKFKDEIELAKKYHKSLYTYYNLDEEVKDEENKQD